MLVHALLTTHPEIPAVEWTAAYVRSVSALHAEVTQINVHVGFDDAELRNIAGGRHTLGSGMAAERFGGGGESGISTGSALRWPFVDTMEGIAEDVDQGRPGQADQKGSGDSARSVWRLRYAASSTSWFRSPSLPGTENGRSCSMASSIWE